MKKLLCTLLVTASLAPATIVTLLPPPAMYLEEKMASKDAGELFDKLAKVDDEKYCFDKRDEQEMALRKEYFTQSRKAFLDDIYCFTRGMQPSDVAELASAAEPIAEKEFGVQSFPKVMLDHLYEESLVFLGDSDTRSTETSARLLDAARSYAKKNSMSTAALERTFIDEGYRMISIVWEGTNFSEKRMLLRRMREIARENNIDPVNLEQRAGEELKDDVRRELGLMDVEKEDGFIKKYPDWRVRVFPYIEAYRFAEELLLISADNDLLIEAAIDHAKALMPYAKQPPMKYYAKQALDFATIVSSDYADAFPQYEKPINDLRKQLRTAGR
jgi:hypothetical protein